MKKRPFNWLKLAVIAAFVLYFSVFACVFYTVQNRSYTGVTRMDISKLPLMRKGS